jgi:hypothetical protein
MGAAKPEHLKKLDALRDPSMPLIEEMSLQRKRQSLYCVLMHRAWSDAGECLDDAGVVSQYLDTKSSLLFVEFDGGRDVKQMHRPDEDLLVVEFESDG